MDGNTVVVKSI